MAGGWIHLITGCMFSGKTDEMLRLIRRAEIAGRRVLLVRPALDSRTVDGSVESRSGVAYKALTVKDSSEIPPIVTGQRASVVAIDEAQFFDDGLPEIAELLAAEGRSVLISGLDQDFLGRPFNSMPTLLALADQVTKLSAICTVCGADATRTQRLVGGRPAAADDPLIVVGGMNDDRYEARCRAHHVIGSARGATSDLLWDQLPAVYE
ncbi:MAG TPA: thymidine kinase [Candidatus Deferrimicrobium sp.]|nr:thymidine kinase [Candidatus Deferrimicrobium sp.]